MLRYRTYFLLLLVFALLLAPGAVSARDATAPAAQDAPSQPETLLIGVEQGLTFEQVAEQMANAGLQLVHYWERFAVAEVVAPVPAEATAMTAAVQESTAIVAAANPQFRYVEPNQLVYAASAPAAFTDPPAEEPTPNDPRFAEQYAPVKVQSVESWNISKGDSNVVIGVIDSGYQPDHPDLQDANIWSNEAEVNGVAGVDDDGNGYIDDFHGWDWFSSVTGDNDPTDELCGHGTHTLGTIAAVTNNNVGVANVGGSISVAPLRMLGSSLCSGSMPGLLSAIFYAIDQDMDIVSLSLTTYTESASLQDAVEAAHDAGVIVVAAAGNYNSSVLWPAAYPEVVAVAATTSSDIRWVDGPSQGSNYGPEIDVAAPGQSVLSTWIGSNYLYKTGTSMATPHVSALFGLLRSLRPDLSGDDLLAIMKDTADDVNADTYPGDDDYLGAGRINYYSALMAASSDIAISVDGPFESPVAPGEKVSFDVSAKAGGSRPVRGASVYVQLLSASQSAEADSSSAATTVLRSFTDASGVASFELSFPITPGEYVLRTQLGASVVDRAISVNLPPELTVFTSTLDVGTDSTPLEVRVVDINGDTVTGDTQINLEATIGHFDVDASEVTAVAVDGLFTYTLYAGKLAGKGTITVTAPTGYATQDIVVLPGEPEVVSLEQQTGLSADAGYIYVPFELSVMDMFGNSVTDGTQVAVTDNISSTNEIVATSGGKAELEIAVPTANRESVYVTALIAGTNISHTVEAVNVLPQLYFPWLVQPE